MASIQQVTVPPSNNLSPQSTAVQFYDWKTGTWKQMPGLSSLADAAKQGFMSLGNGIYWKYLPSGFGAGAEWINLRETTIAGGAISSFGTPMASSPNLDVTFDAWGSPIPLTIGHVRIMGKMIWGNGLEVGTSVASPAFLSFAIGFCYPLDPLEWQWIETVRLWANGIMIFGGTDDLPGLTFTFYEGKEDAPIDPLILADKGAARTPAFRGLRYIVFQDFPLAVVGNSLPMISAEFNLTKAAPAPLINVADILKKIAAKSGVTLTTESNFDDQVAGAVFMSDVATVALMRDLSPTYNYLILDDDGAKLSRRAIDGGLTLDATIDVNDMLTESPTEAAITFERKEQSEIANILAIQYTDVDLAFTNGLQSAKRPIFPIRQVLSDKRDNVQLPFCTDAVAALALAYDQLYRQWTEQLTLKFKSKNILIEVGDVILVQGHELGDFVVRVTGSNLRFDTAVVNEITASMLLKRSGIAADNVSADSGDYISNTIIAALNYPDINFKGSGLSSLYPYMGHPIIVDGTAIAATSAPDLGSGDVYGTSFASTTIPTKIPRSAFASADAASQDAVITAGPRLQDARYVYSIDHGRSGIQRINKSNTKDTQYLDLTALTPTLPPNGNQFAISGGYMYWASRSPGGSGDLMVAYRLDLSLFSAAGLKRTALDSDTVTYSQVGAAVVGTDLLLTTFDRDASSARLYVFDLTDAAFSTFFYLTISGGPAAGQGFLGRGVSSGGFGYFMPLEAHETAGDFDDESANKALQVYGAKIDPSAFTVVTGDTTLNPADEIGVTLSGGNLTAHGTSTSDGGVRAVDGKSTGLLYIEVKVTGTPGSAGFDSGCGICRDDATLTDIGNSVNNAAMVFFQTGHIWNAGSFTTESVGACSANDVIGMKINLTAKTIAFNRNNGTYSSAFDISSWFTTGHLVFPAISVQDNNVVQMVANFGATSFAGTVPGGYTAGWPKTGFGPGTGGIVWFNLTDDAHVTFATKGDCDPWTDDVNLYFLANSNHTSPFTEFLAARKLADLSVVSGFDLTSIYDDTKFDFFQGCTDGTSHFIIGTNYNDGAGAILKVEQDLSAGQLFYREGSTVPLNDDFANAAPVTLNTIVTTSNILATKQAGEPNHNGNAGGASIWYAFTAPSTGTVTIDATKTTEIFAEIGVYTGTAVNALTTVASGSSSVAMTFAATSGTRYMIAFDGQDGITGTIKFKIS